MNSKKYLLFASAVIITTTLLFTISLTPTGHFSKQNNDLINIGGLLVLSGKCANIGTQSQKGIEMALKEVNLNGGINGKKIQIIYEDTVDNNPISAINSYHKLKSSGIQLILGPSCWTSGLAITPIACKDETLLISPSIGSKQFYESCTTNFDLWLEDDILSNKMANYLYDEGKRRIAILGSDDSWDKMQAENVKNKFESLGGRVVSFELPLYSERNFSSEALKIKQSHPEAIIFTNYSHGYLAAKKLREIGVNEQFYSILIDDTTIKNAQGAFEGTIVINSFTPNNKFLDKFKDEYLQEAYAGADTGYDSIMLLVKAIRETNSTNPKNISEYLLTIKEYDGASGKLKFSEKGGIIKEPILQIVKDGKLIRNKE